MRGERSERCWAEKAAGGLPVAPFCPPGPLPAPRHGTVCSCTFEVGDGEGGRPVGAPVPGLHRQLHVELQVLTVQLPAPSCCPAWERSACPSGQPEAGCCGCGSRCRGTMAVLPWCRLSDGRQSGGGRVTETAVNLCGRIAACKYITGAQQVPRHIRPGEKKLQGETKGSLQWNSCGISFPREIFPPNPP